MHATHHTCGAAGILRPARFASHHISPHRITPHQGCTAFEGTLRDIRRHEKKVPVQGLCRFRANTCSTKYSTHLDHDPDERQIAVGLQHTRQGHVDCLGLQQHAELPNDEPASGLQQPPGVGWIESRKHTAKQQNSNKSGIDESGGRGGGRRVGFERQDGTASRRGLAVKKNLTRNEAKKCWAKTKTEKTRRRKTH